MANQIQTIQGNIKQFDRPNLLNYSLFLGGLNAKKGALAQYDPLKTGYSRIFFTTMPFFMDTLLPEKTKIFRHIMEYGFTKIDGIQNTNLDFEQMTGGYSGRSLDVASIAKDDTNSITISTYDFAGSPVREYVDTWITGISDPYTGIGHYHFASINGQRVEYKQSNHIAEAFYVVTGPTGEEDDIEYACLLTNMMPKSVKKDHLNYESGQHNIVQTDIEFTAVKYESAQINSVAKALIKKYKVLRDYINFHSDYTNVTSDIGVGRADITDWKEGTATITSEEGDSSVEE